MNTYYRLVACLICLLFTAAAFAQKGEPYTARWKKADSLIDRGLPESARKIVDKIYAEAQAGRQDVQMLKAQIYLMRINASNKEDADSLNIAFAEGQIHKTVFPISAVWRSIAAQLYWHYYQTNRYKILSRTRTSETVENDFEQWDASKFFARSTELYVTSLGQAAKLKRIPIDSLNPVLIKGTNTQSLRPTLFDLLAFRAIDFFENDEKDLTKPAYQFVMDDEAAFAPASLFVQHPFKTQDSTSMQYLALKLYQEVLSMHAMDANKDALIDADLQRLQFAYQHSVHPDKKELYRKALERIERDYGSNPLSALASYRIAELMMKQDVVPYGGEEDEDGAQKPKADLRAVKAKLDSIIAKYPESEGGIAARQLVQNITAAALNITAEEAGLPNEYSRILVGYKNVPKAFIRVVKMNADEFLNEETRYGNEKFTKSLLSAQPVQSFSVSLPGTEDYQHHSAEVKIDPLPLGMYAVLVSAKESFAKDDNAVSYALFQSTRLAVITQSNAKGQEPDGYVLNRRSGEPISGAGVSFFTNEWNGRTSKYQTVRTSLVRTGGDGAFRVKGEANYSGIVVKKDDDAFYSNSYIGFYKNNGQAQESERTFFFTDRSIYRPGQPIYFKGILVHSSAEQREHNVIAGRKEEVRFYDANGQEIGKQTLTSNEWGSISGMFTAPKSGLTGQMRIASEHGEVYISLEEYKRPKFRVDWDTLKTDYALGEQVAITGYAQAYGGNNVDGATVKYRVVRNVRWPYWWYAWKYVPGPGRSSGEQQMAEGTITTDASGKFTVRFTALPDRSIDERSLPVFTYTVYADVTDVNGETRSGQKSISAGYRSLQIVADIPEQASRKDLDTVHITTQNLNGDFVAASVHIKVARLEQPDVVYRKRLWQRPDQYVMSEAEFRKAFPLDAYKDEDDYRKWKEAEIVLERTVKTTKSGLVTLPKAAFFRNSWYCISISTKDKNGKAVEEKKYVQVWDEGHEGRLYEMFAAIPRSQVREPGEKAMVNLFAGTSDYWLIHQVQTMDRKVTTALHIVDTKPAVWSNLVTKADRGGFAISYITVKDNRVYTASARVDVPWTNKELSIEWETHRDKLQPGQQETWTMVVRGNKKDKVAAELVAALYDASLDAFRPHGWGIGGLFPSLNADMNWQTGIGFGQATGRQLSYFNTPSLSGYQKRYDNLLIDLNYNYGLRNSYQSGLLGNFKRGDKVMAQAAAPRKAFAEKVPAAPNAVGDVKFTPPGIMKDKEVHEEERPKEPDNTPVNKEIPLRKNLQETAFFYPQLHTDADGAVRITFGVPEALTEWKLLAFAHTKDMRTGYTTGTVKTQKDLMVQPGLPRFLRQGDEISLSTKIVNLSDKELNGEVQLEIIDALTGKKLNGSFRAEEGSGMIRVPKGGSISHTWLVHVPESRYEPVTINIWVKAGTFTDGEQNTLPVLTNRMLVTETLPMWMNGGGTKSFSFDKLKASASSNTLAQHGVTVEYTSNPAWYAVKALPYLMEYPYECAEQTFNRYYANALAAHILDKAPKVKAIFKKWREEAMLSSFRSPLETNQELKFALLEETPWVLEAQDEKEQRKNIALLFETDKLAQDLDNAARKLEDMMLPEGGWPWFKGDSRPDRYITQYIVTGIGRLQHLGVQNERVRALAERAMPYLDRQMQAEYDELLRRKANMQEQQNSYIEIQYGYMRSFFPQMKSNLSAGAQNFYRLQANKYWPRFNPYLKGMMAIAAKRYDRKQTAGDIIQSLKETSIQKEELGMYWMEPGRSWWWYEAPIEAQSLLIECFGEVANDEVSVDKMKRWLLKQKQTQNWGTTKATADACYALLLQGAQWLSAEPKVNIQVGDRTIRSEEMQQEAGSGYFKVKYAGSEVKPEMGNITLTVSNEGTKQPSWGAVYWQYFENMDKISTAATPLQVKKAFFIEKNSDRGPVLEAVRDGGALKIGDKVKARIEIIVDRDMEYVHLKDGRASCFEPVNVLSGYRWQGGLGYYESTRDASSNFFFSYLPRGKYVFEYPMFVTNAGSFSAGLATMQCMYAPEFSAHSEGLRVEVK